MNINFPVPMTAFSRKPHVILADAYSANCPVCGTNLMIFSVELGAMCSTCGTQFEVDFDREIITGLA